MVQYIAQEGERWDSISVKAYGSPFFIEMIISANPNIPVNDRLSAGTIVNLPVVEEFVSITQNENLPPWKRKSLT